jgi:predicted RNase H-like nuclease (RuvC/YqgF family)
MTDDATNYDELRRRGKLAADLGDGWQTQRRYGDKSNTVLTLEQRVAALRAENDRLRAENARLRESLADARDSAMERWGDDT